MIEPAHSGASPDSTKTLQNNRRGL